MDFAASTYYESEQIKSLIPVRQPVWNNANSLKIILLISSFVLKLHNALFKQQESVCSSATSLRNLNIIKH